MRPGNALQAGDQEDRAQRTDIGQPVRSFPVEGRASNPGSSRKSPEGRGIAGCSSWCRCRQGQTFFSGGGVAHVHLHQVHQVHPKFTQAARSGDAPGNSGAWARGTVQDRTDPGGAGTLAGTAGFSAVRAGGTPQKRGAGATGVFPSSSSTPPRAKRLAENPSPRAKASRNSPIPREGSRRPQRRRPAAPGRAGHFQAVKVSAKRHGAPFSVVSFWLRTADATRGFMQ